MDKIEKQSFNDALNMGYAVKLAEQSYSNELKVGAVLVKRGRIIATGYNGTPEGWDNACEDEHGDTHKAVLHAEENALNFCMEENISVENTTLYVTHSPCIKCCARLFGKGLKRIVYLNEFKETEGIAILKTYGVQVDNFSKELGL